MTACPDPTTLSRLLTEALSPEQQQELEAHLETCIQCQRHLDRLTLAPAWLRPGRQPSAETMDIPPGSTPADLPGERARKLDPADGETLDASSHQNGAPEALHESDPWPQIPGYEIVREHGHGGMGIVYQARQLSLNRAVALKVMRQFDLATPEQLLRFRMEAELAAQVKHTNIVQVYEVGAYGTKPYLAMEWVPGGNLAEHLDGRPQEPHRAAEFVETLAHAVHAAHAQGVIHRDLKPANILLAVASDQWPVAGKDKGPGASSLATSHWPLATTPKIADFGLARPTDGGSRLTETGAVVGTPEYMSPEQAAGRKSDIGVATDIYSLGVLLYEMLTGKPPFRGANVMDTLRQVAEQEPPSLSSGKLRLPRDLRTICLKCLEKDPAKRYRSAAGLADDLRRWLNKEPIQARPVGRFERLVRWCQRRPVDAALTAAVLLVALFGLAGILWQWNAAVQLSEELKVERNNARWQLYRANLKAVSAALSSHNVNLAGQALEAAPEEYRGWEWRHFHSLLDSTQKTLHGPDAVIDALDFSPDGQRLATFSRDYNVRLWEVASGKLLRTFAAKGASGTQQVQFSPDGKRLVAAAGKNLYLWEVESAKSLITYVGQYDSLFAVFSPDGSLLVSANTEQEADMRGWDAHTGKALWTWTTNNPHKFGSHVEKVAFHPDGQVLVLATVQGDILLLCPKTGQHEKTLHGHQHVSLLAFSPDGTKLASGGRWPDNTVRLWDTTTWKCLRTLHGHKNAIESLRFSPDGSRLVSGSLDQTARLWDTGTGGLTAELRGHSGSVERAFFNPEGSRILTLAKDNTLRAWDAATGELILTLVGVEYVDRGSVAYHALTATAASNGGKPGEINLWNLDLLESLRILRGHTSFAYDAAFSPNGSLIASAGWDGKVRLWDASTGAAHSVLVAPHEVVSTLAFDARGQKVAALTRKGVALWDLHTGQLGRFLQKDAETFSDRLAFHPIQPLVAAGTTQGSILLWDITQGKLVAELSAQPPASITTVRFDRDGTVLAAVDSAGMIRLWDPGTHELLAAWKGHDKSILGAALSPDGRLLATASQDGTVGLWEVGTKKQVAVLKHPGNVYDVAFHPDGTRLASACIDHTIRLWDTTTWEEVVELRGHQDYVHSVAFSPDGTRLVSASGDHTVRLWDTVPLKERAKNWQPAKKLPPSASWHGKDYVPPQHYLCYRAAKPLKIDGKLDDPAWQAVPWTDDFVDIEGAMKSKPRFKTRAKMLWDDEYFCIAAELEDSHVWGTLTKHDSVIFHDNDFEVFIDPDGDNHKYMEYEINALGTAFDLFLPKPYKDGGKPDHDWNIVGVKKGIHVHGTLNDPGDTDKGWTVEIALPWKELGAKGSVPFPPRDGVQWRVNFSRVQWKHEIVNGKYQKIKGLPEDNWVWSPQYAVNMHRPETWGHVQFSTAPAGIAKFKSDPTGPAQHLLHHVHYAQRQFQHQHGRWASNLHELGLEKLTHASLSAPLSLQWKSATFVVTAEVRLEEGKTAKLQLHQDAKLEVE